MASRRETAPSRQMRRVALVICEGETEECYINLLKRWYKSPIRIVSRIEGTKITQHLVDKRTSELKISRSDKVTAYLMYDMDVPVLNKKIMACKAVLLLSNPCFEIWPLLHTKNQKSPISTDALLKELKKSAQIWKNYAKPIFTETQQAFLRDNTDTAIVRAKNLKKYLNPSTEIYRLIEQLQKK
jgi:hypothetical protein